MTDFDGIFRASLGNDIALKQRVLATLGARMKAAAALMLEAYRAGGKVIFMGNGGSAADAQHLAAEMEGRFGFDRRPMPALALHANGSSMTAIGNDYGYEQVYARLLTAHARPGDVAVGLSTSGTSKNILAAARLRESLGIRFIAMTGENGAALAPHADVVIAVPSRDTPRIQECHIALGHILCDFVERSLFRPTEPKPALFLDRDGVLNVEVNYLHKPRDLVVIPGAARTVARFNRADVPVVVVTNQAGIGRGYYDHAAYESVNRAMSDLFAADGARVDAWYHCPHAPGDGCDCRKPRAGLMHAAATDLGLDLVRSALVGDKLSDLHAALAVGARPFLVRTGHGARDEAKLAELGPAAASVAVFDSLTDAEPALASHFGLSGGQPR